MSIGSFIEHEIRRDYGRHYCEAQLFKGSHDETGESCGNFASTCPGCGSQDRCSEHGTRCPICGTWFCDPDCMADRHECRREVMAIADFLHEHHHIADRPDKGQDCYICVSDARQIEAKRKQALGEVA